MYKSHRENYQIVSRCGGLQMVEIIRSFEFLFNASTESDSTFSVFLFRSFHVVKFSEFCINIRKSSPSLFLLHRLVIWNMKKRAVAPCFYHTKSLLLIKF